MSALHQRVFILVLTLGVRLSTLGQSPYVSAQLLLCVCVDFDLITRRLTFRKGGSQFRLNGAAHVTYCIKLNSRILTAYIPINTAALPPAGH